MEGHRGIIFATALVVAVIVFVVAIMVGSYDISQTIPTRQNDRQLRALEDEGYTNIQILDTVPFMKCSDSDSLLTSRDFEADNVVGRRINGEVCCGAMFKGCTVRH